MTDDKAGKTAKKVWVDALLAHGTSHATALANLFSGGIDAAYERGRNETLEAMQKSMDEMRAALEKCFKQFQFYAAEHYKAGKFDKGNTNKAFMDMCAEALANSPLKEE